MLGKRPRDDDALDESCAGERSKRQRTEINASGLTLLDIPIEILGHIVSFLDMDDVCSFRLVTRKCLRAMQHVNAPHMTLGIPKEEYTAPVTPNNIVHLREFGFIGTNTSVTIKVNVSPPKPIAYLERFTVFSTFEAIEVAAALTALNHCCRSVTLEVMSQSVDQGSHFFGKLNETLGPEWTPTYNMLVELRDTCAMPESGKFIQRFKCQGAIIDDFRGDWGLSFVNCFSHCSMLHLTAGRGLGGGFLSLMAQSCKRVSLVACEGPEYRSPVHLGELSHCESIDLELQNVTDEALLSLTSCKHLSIVHCKGFTQNGLFALYKRGVAIDLDGHHWTPMPMPPSPMARFKCAFEALGPHE